MIRRQGMRALVALLAFLSVAPVATGQDGGVLLPVDENDVLILEVRAERYLASSGLIGYRHDDRVLLPLGELAAVLEYAIIAYPERGLVEGWLVDESRTFHLDVNNRSVTITGHQSGLPDRSLYVNPDDIYVDSRVLTEWWPIDLEIDLAGLRVTVVPRETVPLIARLTREARWEQMNRSGPADPEYPRNEAEYRLAAWPFLDASISVDAREDKTTTYRGSILSRGDLARLSVTGFLGYDNQATNELRGWLRAGRNDADGELLGPLGSTTFTFGDVVSTPLALIDGATRGRGAFVSNRPLGSVSQFDAVDITGDVPPGWEVELYLDGALHDLQTGDASGHYFFPQVPLHLGLNTIRAVLYGPNGQTREDVRTYNIRSGMWRKGQLNYNYSSLQQGESILGLPTAGASVPGEGEWDHRLELGYGLGHTTTLGAAFAQVYVDDGLRQYAQGRLLQSAGPLFLQGVGVKDLDEGWAASLSGQMLLGRKSVYLGWSEFSDYHSNTNEGYGDLARRLEARLSGAVRSGGRNLLGYRFKWQREDSIDELDRRQDFWDLYLSTAVGRVSISHTTRYLQESGAYERDELLGNLRLAGYLAGLRLSSEMEYDATGGDGVRTVGLVASTRFNERLTTQLTGRRSFLGAGATYIQGQLDWHLRPVRLGLRGGYDSQNGGFVGLSATTSLVHASEGGGWVMSNRPLTNHGAALVRAFIDLDNDGVFGGGDEELPDVGFGRNPLWQDVRTADDGLAFLPGLPADQFVNVKVDPATVEDPFLVPAYPGVTTVVHPGGVANLSFPFHYVGEIEGIVARDATLTRPMRNVGLELLDRDGNRVATTVSEFDGFYLFQKVLPGDYYVGVVESTLRGAHYVVPEPQPVTMPLGGDFVHGPAIVLRGALDEPEIVVVEAETIEPEPELEPEAAPETVPVDTAAPVVAQGGGGGGTGSGGTTGGTTDDVDVAAVTTAPAIDTGDQVAVTTPDPEPASPAAPTPVTPATPTSAPTREPAPAPTQTAAPDSDTVRSLHLIHELLFESALFAGDTR